MKTEERYELTPGLATAVSLAGVRLRKDNAQVVEEALRRDPLIAEIVGDLEKGEDLPDYNPKRAEKIPA